MPQFPGQLQSGRVDIGVVQVVPRVIASGREGLFFLHKNWGWRKEG